LIKNLEVLNDRNHRIFIARPIYVTLKTLALHSG